MITLAVDPGLRGCGVSLWRGTDLEAAAYVRNHVIAGSGPMAWRAMAYAVKRWNDLLLDRCVIEGQRVYGATKQGRALGADPNDLLELAGVAGAIAALCGARQIDRVYPSEWKGQITKDICKLRVSKKLSPEEQARIVMPSAAGLAHNVYDALGIGLWAVGRWRETNATISKGSRDAATDDL